MEKPGGLERDRSAYFFCNENVDRYEIPGWDEFVTLVIGAFTAFGIFNNPEKKSGF